MSNIDKQALPELRERFETWWEVNYHNGNPPRFGWAAWRDGDGYKIDDDESELDGMWQAWQAAHSGKMEAAEKRIAELEAQDAVVNIKPPTIGRAYSVLNHVWTEQEVRKACELAGIKLNIAAAGKGE